MKELYLITGAAGHLGQAFVRLLLNYEKDLRILVMKGERHIPPGSMEVCYGDVRDRESLECFFYNPESRPLVVIHMAGVVSILSKYQRKVYDINVKGTDHMLELAIRHRVKRFIYISSVHAMPEALKGTAISETGHFHPDLVVGHYAKSKAIATSHVLRAAKKGLNVNVLHPSGIIGPYDYGKGHLTTLVAEYCKGALWAGARGGYDFVDVRDVARGIYGCLEKGKPGECYILSGQYYTIEEILEKLSDLTGGRRISIYFSAGILRIIAPVAQLYYLIRRKPPLFTPYSVYTLHSNGAFSRQKAETKLGYRTTPIEKTLKDTLRWMKRENCYNWHKHIIPPH